MSKPSKPELPEIDIEGLRPRLETLIDELSQGLIERDLTVRLAVLAMLSGEHLLLIGPPGTAKSEVARRLVGALDGGEVFERLLTRFSVPEELFGPLSVKGLEDDRYERKTDGYLPTASVAFIDEIFKANSAILNALLTLLNERKFDNGNERQDAPLLALVGASNELPQDEVLQALYDRFLFRCHVKPVTDDNFTRLLVLDVAEEFQVDEDAKLTRGEIEGIEETAANITVPRRVVEFLGAMRSYLASQEIYVSDRRWMKAVKMLKTAALTNGQDEVTIWDCWLLQHCLWNEPEERETIQTWYEERIGARSPAEHGKFERLISRMEKLLQEDQSAQSHACDEDGNRPDRTVDDTPTAHPKGDQRRNADGEKLFLAPSGNDRTNGGKGYTRAQLIEEFRHKSNGLDYIKTPNGVILFDAYCNERSNHFLTSPYPTIERTRYSTAHIDHRVKETKDILVDVVEHIEQIELEIDELQARIEAHLWVDTDFADRALTNLMEAVDAARGFRERLEEVRDGFAELPVQEDGLEV